VTGAPPVAPIVSCCATLLLAVASTCFAAERYVRASVNQAGQLRIMTSDGRAIVLEKGPGQVGFDHIAVSQDGHSVGWLALYPNCRTSYPIPLKLVVYSGGQLLTFTGNGLPVFDWHFTAGGKQVAYEQETVHGGWGIHYELREVTTGRLVAEYSPEYDRNNQPLPNQKVPKWVAELNAQ